MRLKLDIRELRTFRTKHTINDLKTKKTITQSLCGFPFNEANRGNFFPLGGGGGAGGGGGGGQHGTKRFLPRWVVLCISFLVVVML